MSAKTIKTKPFLLATAGSTVDGRTIDDKMLKEMASSYDPKTYGARVNIEHIRGVSGDGPFNAHGDLVELSTGEVDVNFNGKTEKRTALYGVFEMGENAKALNDANQKVYPSIEIGDNFAGKGFAYCMGVALTDSPASVATERMQFNRRDPGRINLSGDQAAALEFLDDALPDSPAADGLFTAVTNFLNKFTGAAPAPKEEPKAPAPVPAADATVAAFGSLMQDFAKTVDSAMTAQQLAFTKQMEIVQADVKKLSDTLDTTPKPGGEARPIGTGAGGNFTKTDC